MNIIIAALQLLQATVIYSPDPTDPARRPPPPTFDLAHLPRPENASAERPLIVPDEQIPLPQSILAAGVRTARQAADSGARSIVPPLAEDFFPQCRKVADHPGGDTLAGSKDLNGRFTFFQCSGYVADVSWSDYRREIDGRVGSGFPISHLTAMVNRGAALKAFRKTRFGLVMLHYEWVGAGQVIAMNLTADRLATAELEADADRMLDRLTRFNLR